MNEFLSVYTRITMRGTDKEIRNLISVVVKYCNFVLPAYMSECLMSNAVRG